MTRVAKIGLVIGGYVAAIAAGMVATALYNAEMATKPYDTSGGMYAGGEMLTSLAAFLTVALVPTLLALWFLRRHEGFWNVVAIASIAFAGFGLLAVLTPLVTREPAANVGIMLVSLFGLSQLLGVPLWFAAFALFAFLAPTPPIRRRLVVAAAIELGVGFCAFIHWFVPRSPW